MPASRSAARFFRKRVEKVANGPNSTTRLPSIIRVSMCGTDIGAKEYAGFPVGGQFLVCENPEVVNHHLAKVYGQAEYWSRPADPTANRSSGSGSRRSRTARTAPRVYRRCADPAAGNRHSAGQRVCRLPGRRPVPGLRKSGGSKPDPTANRSSGSGSRRSRTARTAPRVYRR
jgi:hypothetical protein